MNSIARRRLLIAAGGTTLVGCGSKTVETSKCYFAGPPSVPEGAQTGPVLPCLGKTDGRLRGLLGDACQKVVEVTGDAAERPASAGLPPSCCYKVEAEEKTCEIGRPMVVAGTPRVARLSRQGGWAS